MILELAQQQDHPAELSTNLLMWGVIGLTVVGGLLLLKKARAKKAKSDDEPLGPPPSGNP
jgi:hypothetical protein